MRALLLCLLFVGVAVVAPVATADPFPPDDCWESRMDLCPPDELGYERMVICGENVPGHCVWFL